MKTIAISPRARSVRALLKRARKENVVLRSPDGDEFLLAEVHDFSREVELARENHALMKFLNSRGRQSQTVSAEDARTMLGLGSTRSTRRHSVERI